MKLQEEELLVRRVSSELLRPSGDATFLGMRSLPASLSSDRILQKHLKA